MMPVLLGAAICGLIAWAIVDVPAGRHRRAARIDRLFAGRVALSPAKFYERYFLDQPIEPAVVTGVRAILEQELETDLSRLHNTDEFFGSLQFLFEFDSMASVCIIIAIEKQFGIAISDVEAENTRTVAQLMTLVSAKVSAIAGADA